MNAPANMTLTTATTAAVTILTIVGLIVLIALGKITAADGLPVIAVLAGVHGGASLTRQAGGN